MNDSLYSTGTEHWSTPNDLFIELDSIYKFTLDACADTTNYKVKKYYTKKDNGLSKSWDKEVVWLNPPYGRDISDWVMKAASEVSDNCMIVMLIPARTDTKWMSDGVFNSARSVCFIKGRLKFSNSKTSAPFPSMIAIFSKKESTAEEISYFNSIGKYLELK